VQEGVGHSATRLLDDLDVVKVLGALESDDGVDSEGSEVLPVVGQKLAAEGGSGDVEQILSELLLVLRVVP
jgi:hypothetical protein